MFRNYMTAALRNLMRNKLYVGINIVGLSVGFMAALLIALFVRDEFSYDKFFPDHERVYLVGSEVTIAGRPTEYPDIVPGELAGPLKLDFPNVAEIARILPTGQNIRRGEQENSETGGWADPNIFRILKFETVAGDLETALTKPESIVLTRALARKYFAKDDPIGETLELNRRLTFTVTAVIEDLPSNTHLNITYLAAGQTAGTPLAQMDSRPIGPGGYGINSQIYLKVSGEAQAREVQAGLLDFLKRHKPAHVGESAGLRAEFILRPLGDLHFAPGGPFGVTKPRGSINALMAMATIGTLIVIVAAINFVNLMTARASRRAIEVGIRKATGASQRNLVVQFIGEALIYVFVSMAIGLALAAVLLPQMNGFLTRTIELGLFDDLTTSAFVLGLAVLTGVLAGLYPAFVLSSFRPAAVLKAAVYQSPGSAAVRRCLVVLQFAVLIGLLVATATVYRQTQFALTDAGRMNTDQVIGINGACRGAFKEGLAALPGVSAVTCSSTLAIGQGEIVGQSKAADGTMITMARHPVGYGFFEFYGLKPVAGRFFAEDHAADAMIQAPPPNATLPPGTVPPTAQPGTVVLNEAAVRRLGHASPADAIGKVTTILQADSEIVGVVPDFALDAVHKAVPPIAYYMNANQLNVMQVRVDGARMPEILEGIDKLWKQVGDPRPIARFFFDQMIATLYADISRQGTLFAIFAGVAIFIALLGLFGMSVSIAGSRIKEIGVRKAMGASRRDILRLLLWQFTKPVLWANLIAWPVAYFVMQRWLEGFAFHIDLAPWVFLAASALAVAIAVLTVLGQALIVARAQPATALRYE